MTPLAFDGSRARIRRARSFIVELEELHQRYAADEPLTAAISFPPGMDMQVALTWKGTGPDPGLVVGDCLHSLRTSLDLMASELARINGNSDKNVYFPFAASAEDFSRTMTARHFDRCGADAMALLGQYAPYSGGNDRLRALHDLDIRDKHVTLILSHAEMHWKIEEREVFRPQGMVQHVPVRVDAVNFIFPMDTPLAGLPVIVTLNELAHLVGDIVEAFAKMVADRPT